MKRAGAMRVLGAAVVGLAVVVACAGALAAGTVKGGTYKGALTVSSSEKVSFKVSGTTVTDVRVTPYVPNRCGVGGPPPLQSSKPAAINGGKFKAELSEETDNGGVSGTATVTGKFLGGGKVKGVVENPLPQAKECAGNFSYTAKLSKR